jgi:hypothetical protein
LNSRKLTLCVHVAFGVSARLMKAIVICSEDVAVNRDVFRDDDEECIEFVGDEELID